MKISSITAYQKFINIFIKQKNKNILHHAFIFKINHNLLLNNFINSLCQILLNKKIIDYNKHPYINKVIVENNLIKTSEIQKIIKNCELSSYNNFAKIIIIEEINLLNTHASNALLKILEEPQHNIFFLMFTKNYDNVLSTIKSRCLTYDIIFTNNDKYNYLRYRFNMSKDAINKSLLISRNDINIITKIKYEKYFWKLRNELIKVLANQINLRIFIKKFNLYINDILYWLNSIIIDIFYYKINKNNKDIANYDKLIIIRYLAFKLTNHDIYRLYSKSLEIYNYFMIYKNIDKELAIENLIIEILQ